jgi:hypothetical protein
MAEKGDCQFGSDTVLTLLRYIEEAETETIRRCEAVIDSRIKWYKENDVDSGMAAIDEAMECSGAIAELRGASA